MTSRTVKLSSGYDCPILGYGTWQSIDPAKLKVGIKAAIGAGYRHIDTAQAYENEHIIGEALQELYDSRVVKREDLFLCTKIFPSHLHPDLIMPTLKNQLEKLKTNYVDLYLIHFPVPLYPPTKPGDLVKFDENGKVVVNWQTKLEENWAAMEKCVDDGLARSIGLSNFSIKQVDRLLKSSLIKPAMVQLESFPAFQNTKLIEFCQKNGVAVTGYSPFGSPGTISMSTGKPRCALNLLQDERIVKIGQKYGKTAAQVILRWQIQRGVVVIPKSLTPSRIIENFNVWDFQLSDEDMKVMASIDLNKRSSWLAFPGIKEHPEYPYQPDGVSC